MGKITLPKSSKELKESVTSDSAFWLLSDIWLIFVNLSCPGCTEATDNWATKLGEANLYS